MSRSASDPPDPFGADRAEPDTSSTTPGRDRSGDDEETLRRQLREASGAAFRRVEATAPPGVQVRMRALRERIRSRRSLDTAWRMMVLALGLTLVGAGLIMFVLPGPGFGATILGLVILASEFTWATRVLDPVKEAARRASEAALDPRRRRRNLTIGALAGVIAAVALIWYLDRFGLTLDPLLELVGAIRDWVVGLFS